MNANAFQCANIENAGKELMAIREYTASCRSWVFLIQGKALTSVPGWLWSCLQVPCFTYSSSKSLSLDCLKGCGKGCADALRRRIIYFLLWPIKLAAILALLHQATKIMDLSIWCKCLLVKNIHMVCFFPNEVGIEAETEVSFIAPAPGPYSYPRQLFILNMLCFVFCLRYVTKSSPSLAWRPDAALWLQKSCLYLRRFSPAGVWSVFRRQFLGLGFWIL